MVIGRDLMTSLGIDISFDKKKIIWEGTEIPMRDYQQLNKWKLSKREFKMVIQQHQHHHYYH